MTLRLSKRALLLGMLALPIPALAAAPIQAKLYKNPQCTCCESYARYLDKHGFKVTVIPTVDLDKISRMAGVAPAMEGCHTMIVDGYVVEGHVPVDIVRKLLTERPKIKGITIPGMPGNLPGMPGARTSPVQVFEVGPASRTVFATVQ